ncbi:M23 family metallopeptidase [Aeromicrobium phragmitis]|uniref:M23 family metallopeptidase n=1 Tax=Aeromicrobium phragmitis TaxID=2478914 RepID=A0A3L8PI53_9ACTN|nr:M23 family metallopeptidase [Aeromicrobium phragmitis]RLV54834.1 M23 family metallopeptidase [Aeromicrobium phragmitis]
MVNPVPGYGIGTPYGRRGSLWSLGWHTGADFPAPMHTHIVSCTPGTVVSVSNDRAYGHYVTIQWEGYRLLYCHMPSGAAVVTPGQTVSAGQLIGSVGDTGNVTGPHLHLEMRKSPYGFNANDIVNPQPAIDYDPQEDDVLTPAQDAALKELLDRNRSQDRVLVEIRDRVNAVWRGTERLAQLAPGLTGVANAGPFWPDVKAAIEKVLGRPISS